jgi:L-threonylcarbamoyladenylate synthase
VRELDAVVEAIRAGRLAIVPTDTVYGLVCSPDREGPVRALYTAKERPREQPTALMAASLELLFERVPELRGRAGEVARALLPGPYTLVLPNPARRFRWLTGSAPEAIGVRVPVLSGPARSLLDRVGALAATSANARGGRDPRRLADVPPALRRAAAAVLDGGELPGTASTVLDFTGAEPRIVREGAASGAAALARAASGG